MQTMVTNRQKAEKVAAERGAAALAEVDLFARCARLRLAPPGADGSVTVRVLGQDLCLAPPAFAAVEAGSGKPARTSDGLLAIHYLLCEVPVDPTGQWISFRDFAGGPFYWDPFRSRTVKPLIAYVGNDLERLRRLLDRLEWQPLDLPAGASPSVLAARIHALGAIDVALIYRQGDDELEPTADLLFDACARRILRAEDAAVLAGRICTGTS